MSIKHIVMSGGSLYGFIFYGILRSLIEKKMVSLHEVTTVHATSVGCIIMIMFVILGDIHSLDLYLIDRPWHNVMSLSIVYLLRCMDAKGMYDMNVIESVFLPVFNAKDIPLSITMLEFYALTHIEFHFFTADVQTHKRVDLSYRSHPDWTVLECVYASCCLPILFKPFCKDGVVYTDGGINCNCALDVLIDDKEIVIEDRKQILCITIDNCPKLKENFTFLEYILKLVSNIINQNAHVKYTTDVHFIRVEQTMTLLEINRVCSSAIERKKLIDCGIAMGNEYFLTIKATDGDHDSVDKKAMQEQKKEEVVQEQKEDQAINSKIQNEFHSEIKEEKEKEKTNPLIIASTVRFCTEYVTSYFVSQK